MTTADLRKAVPTGQSGRRPVVWTRGRRITFVVIGFGSLLIALTGFVGSYTAVRDLAAEKGFGWFATIFPLGIDVGIIVMLSLDLALTWVDLRYPLLRHIAWLLTIATVTFNAMAAYPDILASTMHATIPLLFIAITEAVRHAVGTATARDAGREDYTLSLGRWLLAPWSTWLIWRSRKLWPSTIPSYEAALELYQEKLEYRQELRDQYGRRWRRKAGREELRPLRRSRLGYAVRTAGGSSALAPVRTATPEPAADAARSPEVLPGRILPTPVRTGPAQVLSSPAGRSHAQSLDRPAAVAEPGREMVLDERDHGDAADCAAKEKAGDGDDIGAQKDPLPTIDLGTAPRTESKRQRAERIYRAHQEAGVELTRNNLTLWAGYQKAGSGRAAYVELERKYGPIVIRDEANYALHDEPSPVPS